MPACIASYVVNGERTVACVYHVRDLVPIYKENKRCTSQHKPNTIVELVHRLHGKTGVFFFFVRFREWLKHIHIYVLWDRELGLGMSITKLSVYPFHAILTSLPF